MYNQNDLSVLTYANGFTQWHYKTKDTFSTVMTRGYFNEAADMLRKGDMIQCNLGDCTDFASLWVMYAADKPVGVVGVDTVERGVRA